MARTNIITKDGTKITIEGSPEEVAIILAKIKGANKSLGNLRQGKTQLAERFSVSQKATPINLIKFLIGEDFFKKPRKIGEIKKVLAEKGHLYPLSSLSPALLRLIRKRQIRRIKEKGIWLYTN